MKKDLVKIINQFLDTLKSWDRDILSDVTGIWIL